MIKDISILFEDAHILVCEKPAGIPSQSDKTGDYDMVNYLKNHLYQKNPKGGESYISIVHRLDRPVGGIMVFGKTPQAAKGLSESIRTGAMKKKYIAVLNYEKNEQLKAYEDGKDWTLLTDYLVKDGRTNLSKVTTEKNKNGKKAELLFRVIGVKERLALVEVELLTGRHHQIRVQMAAHIGGIWGDTKYNPAFREKSGWSQIALYSHYLEFPHPRTKKVLTFQEEPKREPFTDFSAENIYKILYSDIPE